ncbi:hypothetical protein MRX96_057607 [Rhipicephalus microplus]
MTHCVASMLQVCGHRTKIAVPWGFNVPTTPTVDGGLHLKCRGRAGNVSFMLLALRTTSSVQCLLMMCGALILARLPHFTTCRSVHSPYFRLLAVDACTLG